MAGNSEFTPGTIVKLKSGSPNMTVKWLTTHGTFLCTWFDGVTVLEHAFAPEQLEKVG